MRRDVRHPYPVISPNQNVGRADRLDHFTLGNAL